MLLQLMKSRKLFVNLPLLTQWFLYAAVLHISNMGVQPLLDAIVDYMPAPTDVESIKGVNPDTEEEEFRHSSDDEPFSALAFKIATDPFVGKICFFRVYSGTIAAGTPCLNSVKDQKERMGSILHMHANHREDIDVAYAGDIAAAVGLKEHNNR